MKYVYPRYIWTKIIYKTPSNNNRLIYGKRKPLSRCFIPLSRGFISFSFHLLYLYIDYGLFLKCTSLLQMEEIKELVQKKPEIIIKFCTRCNWMLRSAWMAQELLSTFGSDLVRVSLEPIAEPAGVYIILCDGIEIWNRYFLFSFFLLSLSLSLSSLSLAFNLMIFIYENK